MNLRQARCHFHSQREAAALCPSCRRTFCRECVTEDRGAMVCLPCLRRRQSLVGQRRGRWVWLWHGCWAALSLLLLYCLFFLAAQWAERLPAQRGASGHTARQASEARGEPALPVG